jgi:hypothetical protein
MHTMMAAADAAGAKTPGKRVALPSHLLPSRTRTVSPAAAAAATSASPGAATTATDAAASSSSAEPATTTTRSPLKLQLEASLGDVARGRRTGACLASARPLARGGASCVVDAGLLMGQSFRVGWGPGGTLAHVGSFRRRPVSSDGVEVASTTALDVTTVSVQRVQLMGAAAECGSSSLRSKHEAALAVHLRHAAPSWPQQEQGRRPAVASSSTHSATSVEHPPLPRWAAHGTRHELGEKCGEYLQAVEAAALQRAEQGGGSVDRVALAEEEQQLWHSTEVWRLLEYLYGTSTPVPALPRSDAGDAHDELMDEGEQEAAAAYAAAVAECAEGPFWRRRVTTLLQDQVRGHYTYEAFGLFHIPTCGSVCDFKRAGKYGRVPNLMASMAESLC